MLFPKIMALFLISFSLFANQLQVKVSGMSCVSCEQKIEKAFKKIDGVKDCKASAEENLITLVLNEKKEVSSLKIKNTIESVGYKFVSVKKTP